MANPGRPERLIITECPRDAMQAVKEFIPTDQKVAYLIALLEVGYPVLDFGSFVSPKAIPQLADTAEVLAQVAPHKGDTKLLAIVANARGAEQASASGQVDLVGFPLSISEQFQQRNTGKNIAEALDELKTIASMAQGQGMDVIAYLSMAFGNPYGEVVAADQIARLTDALISMGINKVALSDTIGAARPEEVAMAYSNYATKYAELDWACHLHALPGKGLGLVHAAWQAGCRRFDGAQGGFGGCPMASDSLTGNMPTEDLLALAQKQNAKTGLNLEAYQRALALSPLSLPH